MAEPARPYTPETLAERWSCSSQHIRDLVAAGHLRAFRVGRLIRIRRGEAESRAACQEEAERVSSAFATYGTSTGEREECLGAASSVRNPATRLNARGKTSTRRPAGKARS